MSKRRRQRGAISTPPKRSAQAAPLAQVPATRVADSLTSAGADAAIRDRDETVAAAEPAATKFDSTLNAATHDQNGVASATVPTDVNRLVGEVNADLIAAHGKRRAELGVDGSGLFNHYSGLLDSGSFLRGNELNAFKLIRETLPAYAEYAVLRAGLGELAFLLERAGLRATACEPNAARFEALVAGVEHCKSSGLEERGRFRTVAAFLPDKALERPLLGVATDFVFNLQLEGDEAFRRGLRRLDGLLVSPRLFIRLRETPLEQRAVITFLRSLGFTEITEFPALHMVYVTRPAGERAPSSDDAEAGSESASEPKSPEAAAFDTLVERVMSLVPPATQSNTGSTWVERRIREFDMKSAFGNDE